MKIGLQFCHYQADFYLCDKKTGPWLSTKVTTIPIVGNLYWTSVLFEGGVTITTGSHEILLSDVFSVNGSGSYEFCQGFGDFVLWVKVSDDNDNVRDDED